MRLGRHGIVAALLGCVMSFALHSIPPDPADCPQGTCAFSAPSGVRGVASAAHWLQVAWNPVPKAYGYRVQVAPENNFIGDRVITAVTQRPEHPELLAIPNLDPGTIYHIRVSVIDRSLSQQSEWSPATFATKGPMRLAVGTYNIHNPDDTWPERGPQVAADILSERLELLGVQEAYRESERRSLLDYVNRASAGVHGRPVYGMAPAVEDDLGYDNRVLYDTRVLTLIGAGGREFEDQEGGDEVDRWFAWATFRHRASGWTLLFVTTHLAPHKPGLIKKQWKELIEQVNSLRRTYRVPWVVVAGDFNTTKFDKPANDMLEAMHDNGYGDVLGQQYRSFDADELRARVTKDAWLDSFNGFDPLIDHYDHNRDHVGNSFDWIFASNELAVPYYRVSARYDDDEKLHEPIASDHFLIRATLAFEPRVRPVSESRSPTRPSVLAG